MFTSLAVITVASLVLTSFVLRLTRRTTNVNDTLIKTLGEVTAKNLSLTMEIWELQEQLRERRLHVHQSKN